MNARRRFLAIAVGAAALAGAALPILLPHRFHYLTGDTSGFVASFAEPYARESVDTRRELDELLALQRTRTAAAVAAARADRKKDLSRFYAALGFDPAHAPSLPRLQALTDAVEDDIGPYLRAVKDKFRRLRPYEIERRLEPCIGDVAGDLSYPSGHAAYGYAMAYLLATMVPERSAALFARAREFGEQRMICGVHFRSDVDAGQRGARMLALAFEAVPEYRRDANAATAELRAALRLPARAAQP